MSDDRTCPVLACGAPIGREMLTCRPDWFSIPTPLRDAVWRTWRAFKQTRTPATLRAYREAREAALTAVDAKVLDAKGRLA